MAYHSSNLLNANHLENPKLIHSTADLFADKMPQKANLTETNDAKISNM